MSNTRRKFGSIAALVVSALIVIAALWVFMNRQYVADLASVWTYTPSAAVTTLEGRTGFTEKGTFAFRATKPAVLAAEEFNSECPRQEVGSPILGCYTGNDRIYIYDVSNAQLDGMKEVTAVHEMLHAVWVRTSESEKARLKNLLLADYQSLASDELKKRMDYYQRTEPGEFINELHSIMGTEVTGLTPKLESYYNQFFSRNDILALHDKYSAVYLGLTNEANNLYAKMEELAKTIDSDTATYTQSAATLSGQINSFNTRANNGGFNSMSQFYTERAVLVSRSNQLEADRESINATIATYNGYYEQYQAIASQLEVLNNSIDSYRALEKAPAV